MEAISSDREFKYSFACGSDNSPLTLKVPINIEELKQKDVPEFCARLINFHKIPCFVETGIISVARALFTVVYNL